MKLAYRKDILRSIRISYKRFASIALIVALGVSVLTGIYATCQDMYASADRFYDEQNLFDIRVVSTLGLTDEDVEVLKTVKGVQVAEGGYFETVHTQAGNARKTAQMEVLSANSLNAPYILEGALPRASGEIAVTRNYLNAANKHIGDKVTIEEDTDQNEEDEDAKSSADTQPSSGAVEWDAEVDTGDEETPTFARTEYTITGVVIDPMQVNSNDDSKSFRAASATDYNFYIIPADADSDIYTAIYLQLTGLSGLNSYSKEYEDAVQSVIDQIETRLMTDREKARYDEVIADARTRLTDAENDMNAKFADAEKKFADAWAEIHDGWSKLSEGEIDWVSGDAEWQENSQKLQDGKLELVEQRQQAELQFADADNQFSAQQDTVSGAVSSASSGAAAIKSAFGENLPDAQWNALVSGASDKTYALLNADPQSQPSASAVAAATSGEQNDLTAAIAQTGDPALAGMTQSAIEAALGLGMAKGAQRAFDTQYSAYNAQKSAAMKQITDAEEELAQNEQKLTDARKELDDGKIKIQNGFAQLNDGEAELNQKEADAEKAFKEAEQELSDNKQKLYDGEAELKGNEWEYQQKKAEGQQKIADAYTDIEEIDTTQWYVQDRDSQDSYSSMKNEMASIEAVGRIFPVIFFVVAILMCLTTMTRMVEEERGLIGTYKSIGLSDGAIYWKYILYALLSSIIGAVFGNLLGFYGLPSVLMGILQTMYTIPYSLMLYYPTSGISGGLLFIAGTAGATAWACRTELTHMPSVLLRPKSPKAGSRVLLERIPMIWNNLKFLNKVTARNLFRYKKRLIMTVAGIMGCTTLLMIGFSIKDTVTGLNPLQYDYITKYDLLAATADEDNDKLISVFVEDPAIKDYLNVRISTVKVINAQGDSESMQMMVVPDGAKLSDYVFTPDTQGVPVTLDNTGILLTENAATELLHVGQGDRVSLQNPKLEQGDTTVAHVVRYYLGNYVYVSQSLYESMFGEYMPNAALAHLADTVTDQAAFAKALPEQHDFIQTAVSTAAMRADFATNFTMLNAVILLLIVMAGGLAFVVLFTLSSTNISERARELATIKVLGFYDMEVHSYVNKETVILTGIGALLGLPVGYAFSGLIISTLSIPSVQFVLSAQPLSYVYSAVISFGFGLIVSLITNRTLDRINMVEALKSIE